MGIESLPTPRVSARNRGNSLQTAETQTVSSDNRQRHITRRVQHSATMYSLSSAYSTNAMHARYHVEYFTTLSAYDTHTFGSPEMPTVLLKRVRSIYALLWLVLCEYVYVVRRM